MSMMMPPDAGAAPGLPVPPGGGGLPGPMDGMNAGPVPGDQGIAGLMAALGGGAPEEGPPGGGPPGAGPPDLGEGAMDMDPVEHIQAAMKHLMMALAGSEDEEQGAGITKGMGALQGLLAGEQKKNAQLGALGG